MLDADVVSEEVIGELIEFASLALTLTKLSVEKSFLGLEIRVGLGAPAVLRKVVVGDGLLLDLGSGNRCALDLLMFLIHVVKLIKDPHQKLGYISELVRDLILSLHEKGTIPISVLDGFDVLMEDGSSFLDGLMNLMALVTN